MNPIHETPGTNINGKERLSHPGNFLFSKILHIDIVRSTIRAIHPAIGIRIKKIHAQWNFPRWSLIELPAKGIHASHAFLKRSFLAIAIQAKDW